MSGPGRVGRPPACPSAVVVQVLLLRGEGLSYGKISDVMNTQGVLTPAGRERWQRSYVDRLLHTRHALAVAAELADNPAWSGSIQSLPLSG